MTTLAAHLLLLFLVYFFSRAVHELSGWRDLVRFVGSVVAVGLLPWAAGCCLAFWVGGG